eukprot:CAMPEP_0115537794 /NCGR_PEP_ID=MMETSP0271-20121206/88517_1 /TAXON_ID=71861 /ORGANISM="Scrippsiella trochoidea, Strain CCMP3099" /LENGTH=115 /DNA_ID=CAMNT_0002970611 /DNA_START=371 /DNA_END=715 /DNA_ORIENTATION=-
MKHTTSGMKRTFPASPQTKRNADTSANSLAFLCGPVQRPTNTRSCPKINKWGTKGGGLRSMLEMSMQLVPIALEAIKELTIQLNWPLDAKSLSSACTSPAARPMALSATIEHWAR